MWRPSALRIAAYTALLTDAYPPFRLDRGTGEPVPRVRDAGLMRGRGYARPAARRERRESESMTTASSSTAPVIM